VDVTRRFFHFIVISSDNLAATKASLVRYQIVYIEFAEVCSFVIGILIRY